MESDSINRMSNTPSSLLRKQQHKYCLDAVCCQVDLAEQIFHDGVSRGFYAKVSRLGTQWFELDLHFLSLGGGETALRWWFEKCLVPYLGNSKELASVKSIDIVTGYGKTRSRVVRKGDDSMRKRVRAMLSFMNVCEIVQPNLGRIHIDKTALLKEVERNNGKITFDAHGYEQFKLQEGLDEPYSDAPQAVRPRGGALHDRTERDRQQQHSSLGGSPMMPSAQDRGFDNPRHDSRNNHPQQHHGQHQNGSSRYDNYSPSDQRRQQQQHPNNIDYENSSYGGDGRSRPDIQPRAPTHTNPRFEPPVRHHLHPPQSHLERDYRSAPLPPPSSLTSTYNYDRKRSHTGGYNEQGRGYSNQSAHQQGGFSSSNGGGGNQDQNDAMVGGDSSTDHMTFGGERRDYGEHPSKRQHTI